MHGWVRFAAFASTARVAFREKSLKLLPTYARFVQPGRLEYFDVGPYRIVIIVVKMQRKDY